MQSLWLYLHFKHLQLDTLFHQQTVDYPVVILDAINSTVVQLNSTAQDLGITIGMGLGTSAALAQDLRVIPYQSELEGNKLNEIADSLYLFTSDISFFPPNGILLRIHNMLSLYGGIDAYWQGIQQPLKRFQLTYDFATGFSPLSARMLARRGWNQITQNYDQLKLHVAQCSLQQTDLAAKTIQKLNRVGIRDVAGLLALPLKDVAKRFDIELVTYLGRLTGEFQHPINFFHPCEHFHRYLELSYDIVNSETLSHPLRHILLALEQFLKVRDQLTEKLKITFHQRDHDDLAMEVGAAEGEYLCKRWLMLSELKLESIKLTGPVYAISLSTGVTRVRIPQENDLFLGKRGMLSNLQLVAMLQAKLGDCAVSGLTFINDFRPEHANQYTQTAHSAELAEMQLHAYRPSFILKQPQPLKEKVTILSGPERLNTGWWDNNEVQRDYFIARSQQGQWYWVYRTADTRWFLHGLFS